MTRRYFYFARTQSGAQHEFDVYDNDEGTANIEAKIEVERWLADIDEDADRLTEFGLTHTTP